MDEEEQPLGWVPVEGRGSLPFSLVHGESLVAAASWAVGEAGVQLYDATVSFDQIRQSGRTLLLHDPLCPLTPVDHLLAALELCSGTGRAVVGFRPVTDTVKRSDGESLGETVDRAGLRSVATPIVIPAEVLAVMDSLEAGDFAVLAAELAERGEIGWLEAPPLARRIHDEPELRILEALSRSLV